jgi:hypothetical protein
MGSLQFHRLAGRFESEPVGGIVVFGNGQHLVTARLVSHSSNVYNEVYGPRSRKGWRLGYSQRFVSSPAGPTWRLATRRIT